MEGYAAAFVPYDGNMVSCVLPLNGIEPSERMQAGGRPYSVAEILRENYKEDYHKAVSEYVRTTPEALERMDHFRGGYGYKVLSTKVIRTESSLHQPVQCTAVDIIVCSLIQAVFDVEERTQSGDIVVTSMVEKHFVDFRIRYYLDMRICKQKCLGPMIEPYRNLDSDVVSKEGSLKTNGFLIPVIRDSDYDRVAHSMLEKYFPEALDKPTKISGKDLAGRMGLNVIHVRMPEDSRVMGQLYFGFGNVEVIGKDRQRHKLRVKPGTILVNDTLCTTYEAVNGTILHECAHLYLDRTFFLLQCMTGKSYTCFINRRKEKGGADGRRYAGRPKTEVDWMETQAEKLPAYILMEKGNTIRVIERELARYGHERSPENMNRIMNRLADSFSVTRSMAKIRMKELGYQEAEGIYNFIDRKHVPDHGCSNAWPSGVTFTVSPSDIGRLGREQDFLIEISRNHYEYVEGHFCLSSDKYIDNRYKKRLTPYARTHMEECCLGFSVRTTNRIAVYAEGIASRTKREENQKEYRPNICLESVPGSKESVKEYKKCGEDDKFWADIMLNMPNDFRPAVNYLLKKLGVTQEGLAEKLGISRSFLVRMLSQEMKAGHLVGICVALKLRFDVSMRLFELSGKAPRYRGVDTHYITFLLNPMTFTIERCNEYLISNGYEPLFPKAAA